MRVGKCTRERGRVWEGATRRKRPGKTVGGNDHAKVRVEELALLKGPVPRGPEQGRAVGQKSLEPRV